MLRRPFPASFQILAGAEGFEPPSSVLETDSLTVELTPLHQWSVASDQGSEIKISFWPLVTDHWTLLLHFLMRRMLAATVAEFLKLQPFRRRLPVLGRRIIPLFAIAAL
jgi:hypothetical protein